MMTHPITIVTTKGYETGVPAVAIIGGLAVCQPPGCDEWTVTHLKTGKKLFHGTEDREFLVELLVAMWLDGGELWEKDDPDYYDRCDMRDIIERHAGERVYELSPAWVSPPNREPVA